MALVASYLRDLRQQAQAAAGGAGPVADRPRRFPGPGVARAAHRADDPVRRVTIKAS